MEDQLVAHASLVIDAPVERVWDALVDPEIIKQYMFGTWVTSDWKVGSEIRWTGIWDGKPYEDRGVILQKKPGRILQYSHFSPLSGQEDTPENYHVVTIELFQKKEGVLVTLAQDNNHDLETNRHSEENWMIMLQEMKRYLEARWGHQ